MASKIRNAALGLALAFLTLGTVAAQDITIEIVGWGTGQAVVYEGFMERNPSITVTEQMMDFGDLGVFLKTRFLAGEAPDIVQLQPGQLIEFTDNLLPLDELIANDPDLDLADFVQPVLGTTTVGGSLLGIPQHPMVSGMIWFNKDIFDDLGLQVPTDYDGLKAVSQACRDAGHLPLIVNGGDSWNRLIVTEQLFSFFAPGKMAQAVAGEIPWTDPDLVAGMAFWKTMVDDGVFQDGVMGADFGTFAAFTEGNGCMAIQGSWAKGGQLIGIRPDTTVGYTLPMPFPDLTNGGATWMPAIASGHAFAINKDSPNIEAAWEVMKEIILLGDPLASYPVLIPVYATSVPSAVLANATDAAQLAAVEAFELGAWQQPFFLDDWVYAEVRDAIAEAASGVATGQVSAEVAMAEVQRVAERVLGQ
jgi:raffinose/stachyose/melibiose transport system substrate-binding protein